MNQTMTRRMWIGAQIGAGVGLAAAVTGLDRSKIDQAAGLVRQQVEAGKLKAAALSVRYRGERIDEVFGEAKSPDALFLIASITKPMTAAGIMRLVERGTVKLSDPVMKYLPAFSEGDKKLVTIQNLLTHTSGLPDQLPENVDLRKRHATLEEFVERVMKVPLKFKPGTKTSYQSMGILLAAEIAERVTNLPFREYLAKEVFTPLEMKHTALGLGRFSSSETMPSQVEYAEAEYGGGKAASWDWNSLYWRDLGSPWGGAHSTGPDISRFLQYFLHPSGRWLSAASVKLMTTDQNPGLNQPYAVGFAVGAKRFGKGCSPQTFGHGGSTGTLCWADPAKDLSFVLLTTLPARVSNDLVLNPASDLVSQAA